MTRWLISFHFRHIAVSTRTVEASSAFTAIVQARAEFTAGGEWPPFLDLMITQITVVSVP